jgi:hypothetical protein
MKMVVRPVSFLFLCGVTLLSGCGSGQEFDNDALKQMAGGELKERVAISGKVMIDGQPAVGVNVYAYTKESGMKPAYECRTRVEGEYCWSTHESCDGIQPGSYQLAFAHIPKEGRGSEGKDRLNGKYRNPTKTGITLEVKGGGEPQVDVNYELESGK